MGFWKQLFCIHDFEIVELNRGHKTWGPQWPVIVFHKQCKKCSHFKEEQELFPSDRLRDNAYKKAEKELDLEF